MKNKKMIVSSQYHKRYQLDKVFWAINSVNRSANLKLQTQSSLDFINLHCQFYMESSVIQNVKEDS